MKYLFQILFFLFVSSVCFAQTEGKEFELNENLDSFINDINNKFIQGEYEQVLPELIQYRNYYKNRSLQNVNNYVSINALLAQAYFYLGKAGDAEAIYQELLDFLKKNDSKSPLYRRILSDFGLLYYNLRNYNKSDELFSEAIYLFEKDLDLGSHFAVVLSNYALVQRALGNGLWAKMMVDWAKDIYINSPDSINDAYLATALGNLGVIYGDLGYEKESLESMLGAKAIYDKGSYVLGKAELLNNIAVTYYDQKNYSEAIAYYDAAFKIGQNPLVKFFAGMQLAWTKYLTKDKDAFIASEELSQEVISDVIDKFTFMSDEERELFWEDSNTFLNVFNTLFFYSNNADYYGSIFDNSLFSKGLLLKTSNLIKKEIYNSGDKESIDLLNKKIELEKMLDENELQADTFNLIKDEINNYDKLLTTRSGSYASFKKELTTSWVDIKNALSKDEAAIEFVAIPIIENDSISTKRNYCALIVKSNSRHPELVTLCSIKELEELITKDSRTKIDVFVSDLYNSSNTNSDLGNRLYSCIWEPIEKELRGIKTIYYSPIGQLYSISFNALSHNSINLSDKYNLHLMSSTSEVVKFKQDNYAKISDALLYGGIRYDNTAGDMIAQAKQYNNTRIYTRSIDNDPTRSGWTYLEGTESETTNIKPILDRAGIITRLLSNNEANEESFKALDNESPSLLHIATHGFFLSDPVQIELNPFMQANQKKGVSNLLMRSGLLFAGANKAWLGDEVVDGIEDGILTAEEISKLNLSKTQMVVLSACETGLGEIVSTEGVFGLQRAFKLAGVQTLIMSLWKVPDTATSKLMINFYNNWIGGMEKHNAFQKAQQDIKKEYSSPYYWAGFVMLD